VQIGVVTVQQTGDELTAQQLDSLAKSGRGITAVWWRHFVPALRNKAALSAAVTSNIPRMMFVLVPMFAALMSLVFRGRGMRYPQHLAFALHVHAFLFLALILTLMPRIVKNGVVDAIAVLTSFALIASHLVLAVRRVYEVSTGGAIARSALVGGAYFVIYVATFVALFIGAVLLL
jgi:hypothetical protein